MFQQHDNWWDLLCILDLPNCTGHVYSAEERKLEDGSGLSFGNSKNSSSSLPSSSAPSSYEDSLHYSVDSKFIQGVVSGIGARINEDWVRQQFYDYTSAILSHAQDLGGMYLNSDRLNDKTKKFLDANAARISVVDKTSEFLSLPTHPFVWGYNDSDVIDEKSIHEEEYGLAAESGIVPTELFPVSEEIESEVKKSPTKETAVNNFYDGILLKSYIRKLQYEVNIDSNDEAALYYSYLDCRLQSESSMQGLLVLLPESIGGLFPIAVGLFNSNPTVRKCSVSILQNVRKYKSTATAFQSLNPFLIEAFDHQESKLKDGSIDKEIVAMKELYKRRRERLHERQLQGMKGDGDDSPLHRKGGYSEDYDDDEEEDEDDEWNVQKPIARIATSANTPLTSILKRTLNFIGSPDYNNGKFSSSLDSLELLP